MFGVPGVTTVLLVPVATVVATGATVAVAGATVVVVAAVTTALGALVVATTAVGVVVVVLVWANAALAPLKSNAAATTVEAPIFAVLI